MTKPAGRQKTGDQDGLTMVELMVSVLLAAMLTGGLFYVMAGQQIGYSQQMTKTVSQQNLAGTMSFLQRWIRSAGYGMGSCPIYPDLGAGTPPYLVQAAMWDGSGNGYKASSLVAIRVYNHCNLTKTKPADCPDGSVSDSLTVTSVHPSAMATPSMPSVIMKNSNMALVTDPVYVANTTEFPSQFEKGDLALLWDPSGGPCILLEVTTATPGTDMELLFAKTGAYNTDTAWGKFDGGGGYKQDVTRVTRIAAASYPRHFAVDHDKHQLVTWSTLDPIPLNELAKTDSNKEVVAELIEDMQISFGCDVGGIPGMLDEGQDEPGKKTDEWAFNIPGDQMPSTATPPCAAHPVGAVRVTLVSRSASEVAGGTAMSSAPAAEDRLKGVLDSSSVPPVWKAGGTDRHSRTVLTSTIKTVNLRVQ